MTRPICPATLHGYACDRVAGHGMLHRQPETDGAATWWITEPENDAQRRGEQSPTNYRLISDVLLSEEDARLLEARPAVNPWSNMEGPE